MSDQLKMWLHRTCAVTRNATSSLESVSGAMRCDSLNGQMTGQFGQEAALVNPLASLEQEQEPLTNAISGLPGSISSASAALTLSLVNKLKQQLDTGGSILFKLTWKEKTTPAGRLVYRLQASARRTSDNDYGSLPTPSGTSNHKKNHTVGRLDEWGGSSNPFRGTPLGRVRCISFELWMMGLPMEWQQSMPQGTLSSRRSRKQ